MNHNVQKTSEANFLICIKYRAIFGWNLHDGVNHRAVRDFVRTPIPAGRVSNEIVHVVDLLPTLASVAGYEVPDDRIIDGVDQLDFFLGEQEHSNREGFIIYNNDDVYGYKWRNWKMHLIELEHMNAEPRKLNVPRVYNLITDPKEEYNMAAEATWVLPVLFEKIVDFQQTLIEEPPIQLGTQDPYSPPE